MVGLVGRTCPTGRAARNRISRETLEEQAACTGRKKREARGQRGPTPPAARSRPFTRYEHTTRPPFSRARPSFSSTQSLPPPRARVKTASAVSISFRAAVVFSSRARQLSRSRSTVGWKIGIEGRADGFVRRRPVRPDAVPIADEVERTQSRRIREVRSDRQGRARTCWLVFTVHSAGILTSTRAPSALRWSLSSSPSL